MSRRRITQIFPFLLPLRQRQRKACYYARMRLSRTRWAGTVSDHRLPHEVCLRTETMVNPHTGQPIVYQHNKAHNLRLAASTLNGLVIAPGETFSFWWRVRNADRRTPYKDGLVLQDGQLVGAYGGGLCQLSDLLLQLFLRSPLTVVERHPHTVSSFAPAPGEVLGVDATVSEGWLDLKARNPCTYPYQLEFVFDEAHICGRLLAAEKPAQTFELFNEHTSYWRDAHGELHLAATVSRRVTDVASGLTRTERLFAVDSLVGYGLPPGAAISDHAPHR